MDADLRLVSEQTGGRFRLLSDTQCPLFFFFGFQSKKTCLVDILGDFTTSYALRSKAVARQ